MGADMHAGVPFYGAAAETARVSAIKAPLMIQYAENDERVNGMWPAFEAALKAGRSGSSRSTWPELARGA